MDFEKLGRAHSVLGYVIIIDFCALMLSIASASIRLLYLIVISVLIIFVALVARFFTFLYFGSCLISARQLFSLHKTRLLLTGITFILYAITLALSFIWNTLLVVSIISEIAAFILLGDGLRVIAHDKNLKDLENYGFFIMVGGLLILATIGLLVVGIYLVLAGSRLKAMSD